MRPASTSRQAARQHEDKDDGQPENEASEPEQPAPKRSRRQLRKKKPRSKKILPLILGLIAGGAVLLTLVIAGILLGVFWLVGTFTNQDAQQSATISVPIRTGALPRDNYSRRLAAFKKVEALNNELFSALESVKDPASATAATTRINEICNRLETVVQEINSLPKLTPEEMTRMTAEASADSRKTGQRMDKAMPQAMKASRGDQALSDAVQRYGKIMMRIQL